MLTSTDAGRPEAEVTPLGFRSPPVFMAAAGSAGAGLIHAAASASHREVAALAGAFALAAVVQVGWALLALARPRPVVLAGGLAVHGGMVLAWMAAATVGWPVIEAMAEPISVGVQDLMAVGLATVAAGATFVALVGMPLPRSVMATPVGALAGVILLVSAVPAVAIGHSHDHAHDHAHEGSHDHEGDHSHEAGGHSHGVDEVDGHHHDPASSDGHAHGGPGEAGSDGASGGHSHGLSGVGPAYDPDDPIISLDDPRLSEQQRAAALALYEDVQREMARFSDPASAEAEGYLSIGDGITGYEHYSHPVLRMDPITLDPRRPESIVFRVHPDGRRELVSAMFIMPPGTTMDDVPDIAGTLTTWHDHQDLCWIGDRVVGTTPTPGECAFGEFRVGQAMMHVWLVPHPCGPFAGLEGHGGDCRQHAH